MKKIISILLSFVFLLIGNAYCGETILAGGMAFDGGNKKISGTTQFTPPAHSHFGSATTVWGEFAAISAPTEAIADARAGAVYIYRLIAGNWQFFQKITSANPANLQEFGASIKLYENTLLVGATGDDAISGSVYVFDFNGSEWVETQKLVPVNPMFFQKYGFSLDLSHDIALVSSLSSESTGEIVNASGTIYFYRKTDNEWILEDTFRTPDINKNDLFGTAVRIVTPEEIVIAAPRGNGVVAESGLVYSFIKSENGWEINQTISPENALGDGLFGSSMDYSNGRLIVGAMEAKVDSLFSGAAHLYTRDAAGKWCHDIRFVPETPSHHDYFGATVVIDGDYVVIGSPKWDSGDADGDHGTAYIFSRTDSSWSQSGQIIPADLGENDHFGLAMAMDGPHFVVGCSLDDHPHFNNGSSYFYDINQLTAVLSENNVPLSFEIFQNYPNPFNPMTTINYNLPTPTHVNVSVFDVIGRKVVELLDAEESAGQKKVIWNGKDSNGLRVASGTYIYRIETSKLGVSKKMLLLK